MTQKQFVEELSKINIETTEEQLSKLEAFYQILVEHNKITNLTRIIEKEEVYLKHFYDSLTLSLGHELDQELTICDLGSGAGFPGIVLKIFFPKLKISLVDSHGKKTEFLKVVIEELDLKGIRVFNERAEEHALNHREDYDLVTARAVANLPILIELGVPLLKLKGYFLAMKGPIVEKATNPLKMLNAEVVKKIEVTLPITEDKRNIIKIKKINPTNKRYPRNFSQIKKKPL